MFTSNLAQLRQRAGKTKKEVADYLKLHESTYGKYELGHREPNFDIVRNMADYFQVSVDKIIGHSPFNAQQVEHIKEYLFGKLQEIDEVAVTENGDNELLDLINGIVHGSILPTYDDLIYIADNLRCSLDEMIGIADASSAVHVNEREKAFLNLFGALSSNRQEEVIRYLRFLTSPQSDGIQ